MIVLNVTYKCKPGMREAFLKNIKEEGLDAKSRAEAGNIKYDYYYSAADPDELFLLEKWNDEEALSFHKNTPHFTRLGEIKAEYVLDTVIEKYTV